MLLLPVLIGGVGTLQSWIRNFVLCAAVYFGIGAAWSYYIYYCFGHALFRPGGIPQFKDVFEQMKVQGMPQHYLILRRR